MIEIALSTATQRHPFLPFLRLTVSQRRRRSLDERDAHAEADARLWEGLQGMNVELAEGHKDVAAKSVHIAFQCGSGRRIGVDGLRSDPQASHQDHWQPCSKRAIIKRSCAQMTPSDAFGRLLVSTIAETLRHILSVMAQHFGAANVQNPEMCVIADSIVPAATTESAQPNFARGLIFAPAATCGRLLSLLSTHLFLAHL
jgi:hypothetical protein